MVFDIGKKTSVIDCVISLVICCNFLNNYLFALFMILNRKDQKKTLLTIFLKLLFYVPTI